MNKGHIIIGNGGHSKLLIEILQLSKENILGVTDIDSGVQNHQSNEIKVLGNDDVIFNFSNQEVHLINGLGQLPRKKTRMDIYNNFSTKGYFFPAIVHPSVIIGKNVDIKPGAQILAGTILQHGSDIGENTIINTKTSIDHDSIVGNHCHIAPGVTICGNVSIGENTFIGAGSVIINNINIGKDCLIAAGSVVYKDIDDNTEYRN